MSIMSQLADEVLKPVKKGVYITAAVLTVGGLAAAANSKVGRKIGKGISNAVQGKSPEEIKADQEKIDKAKLAEEAKKAKTIDVTPEPVEEPEKKLNKGEQNA